MVSSVINSIQDKDKLVSAKGYLRDITFQSHYIHRRLADKTVLKWLQAEIYGITSKPQQWHNEYLNADEATTSTLNMAHMTVECLVQSSAPHS